MRNIFRAGVNEKLIILGFDFFKRCIWRELN